MEYRLLQDGIAVAWTNSQDEILHYADVYGQDGPVTIQGRVKGKRWRVLERERI